MKKNKLFKQDNNQSTKQVSITMQDSSRLVCNLTKNKITLKNLPASYAEHILQTLFSHCTPEKPNLNILTQQDFKVIPI